MMWTVTFRGLLPADETFDRRSERFLRWLIRLTCRPGFQHCFAYKPIANPPNGLYLLVDPRSNGMNVMVATVPQILDDGYDGVYYASYEVPDYQRGWRPRGLLTCVSVIKHLLGVRAWWIITPHQLYRHLEKQGA